MFDKDSRYARLPIKTRTDSQGRVISYVARRIIAQMHELAAVTRVRPGDRLDLISDRAYGDPRLFWRIADANLDREPERLAETARRRLNIPSVDAE